MHWFILALLASALWAIIVIVDKFVLVHYIKDAFSYQIFITISLIPVVLVLFRLALFQGYFLLQLMTLASGMALGIMFVLYNKALLIEEASRVTPLFFITPLFVVIFSALFLGEKLAANEYLGIGLLVFSAIAVSLRRSGFASITVSPALLMILCLDVVIAGKDIIAKYVFGYIDFWSFLFWFMLGELIARPLFLLGPTIRRRFTKDIRSLPLRVYLLCFITSALMCIGYVFYFKAVSLTYVSLVSAIPSIQPFFVLLFALLLSLHFPTSLNESMERKEIIVKALAALMIVIGSYLIIS
jgi:drug/metabolite transporter (DMT)-like permease